MLQVSDEWRLEKDMGGRLRRALRVGRVYMCAAWQREDAAMGVSLDPKNN